MGAKFWKRYNMLSLEGENEIPHIAFLDFLTILGPLDGCETNFTK